MPVVFLSFGNSVWMLENNKKTEGCTMCIHKEMK